MQTNFFLFVLIFLIPGKLYAACVPPAYMTVASEYRLPASVLYAISLAEAGRYTEQYGFKVWPWALNIDEKPYYPNSEYEAVRLIEEALDSGTNKIAIGAMQVYWRFHKETFNNEPSYALDLASNLRAGAKILKGFLNQTGSIWEAVGNYYAGSSQSIRSRNLAKQYSDRVQRLHKKYVVGECDEKAVHY